MAMFYFLFFVFKRNRKNKGCFSNNQQRADEGFVLGLKRGAEMVAALCQLYSTVRSLGTQLRTACGDGEGGYCKIDDSDNGQRRDV